VQRIAKISLNPRARFWYLEVPDAVRGPLARIARELAASAGGVPDDADHVTLCFVPKSDAPLGGHEVRAAIEAVAHNMAPREPIEVWVGGLAYFDTARGPDNEPATALVALIDGPGLTYLHAGTAYALRNHGWEWQDSHSFTAHCTLAYLPVGARVPDLPVVEARWLVDHVCFANEQVHRIPIGGGRTAMKRTAKLTREDIGVAVGEASMCWEHPELAGVFDSTRASAIVDHLCALNDVSMQRRADLHGEDLRKFRTEPDIGHGRLFTICRRCTFLARSPITGVLGCTKGDDPAVVAYSQRIATGESTEENEQCPGFQPKDQNPNDEDEGQTVRQAARVQTADIGDTEAGMVKEVPGEAAIFDDDVQIDDVGDLDDLYNYLQVIGVDPDAPIAQVAEEVTRGISSWRGGLLADVVVNNPDFLRRVWEGYAARARGLPEAQPEALEEEEHALDPDHYIWRTQHDSKVRSSHRERDGHVYAWDNPPPGGHPGEAPMCRCFAEAVLELPGSHIVEGRLICASCGGARDGVADLEGLFQ
jgi:2'-5' RNA ligase